ncbi:hypothetical protein AOZ07_03145 [Glutamicibacter halophytocola]|uniref:hypothetical protein n=1 Tax=Glutamicibacter halophytocola TaxID=1933880 RepID=UPI0006D4B4A8|nr:hypothetical protein [Glutamicibacter halophytocola]ALG28095.1 hypothetical protein AOZ07_03145 [Glutamicibacter halophytocola]
MAKHEATTTQGAHPWRATVRTIFAAVIALAALAPLIYTAAAQQSPELATGAIGGALVTAGAITRIMAIPGVEAFLQRFLPFLSAAQRNDPNVTGEPTVSEFDALLREGKDSYPVTGPHAPTEADPARYESDK